MTYLPRPDESESVLLSCHCSLALLLFRAFVSHPDNTLQNVTQQSAQAQDPARGLVRRTRSNPHKTIQRGSPGLRRAIQLQRTLRLPILLSIALMGVGQRDEAFSEAKRAIELDPNDAHAMSPWEISIAQCVAIRSHSYAYKRHIEPIIFRLREPRISILTTARYPNQQKLFSRLCILIK
jgi:hypothetical protein